MGSLACHMQDLVPWAEIQLRLPAAGAWSPGHWTIRESRGGGFRYMNLGNTHTFSLWHGNSHLPEKFASPCFEHLWELINLTFARKEYTAWVYTWLKQMVFMKFIYMRAFKLFTQSCQTLCNLMEHSTPAFHVLRYPWVCSNSCWLSQRCHPTISFSIVSLCPQSFSAWGSFPMSQFFASGGQSIGASASASVLPMSIQGWFLLGLTGLISLLSKGLSRVFFSTTVWKHQFFGAQPSLWSNSHICTWLLEKP